MIVAIKFFVIIEKFSLTCTKVKSVEQIDHSKMKRKMTTVTLNKNLYF